MVNGGTSDAVSPKKDKNCIRVDAKHQIINQQCFQWTGHLQTSATPQNKPVCRERPACPECCAAHLAQCIETKLSRSPRDPSGRRRSYDRCTYNHNVLHAVMQPDK